MPFDIYPYIDLFRSYTINGCYIPQKNSVTVLFAKNELTMRLNLLIIVINHRYLLYYILRYVLSKTISVGLNLALEV